jgi:hypothetical protein
MSTSLSSDTPYCTPADVLTFHDANLVAELCVDDGSTLTLAQLLTHPVLVRSVKRAAGDVEMAALVGKRYTPADLAGLTGVGQQALQGLTADLAFWHLYKRRYVQVKPQDVPGAAEALQMLSDLRKGERIFPIEEVADAGIGIEATPLDVTSGKPVRPPIPVSERARPFFGTRGRDMDCGPTREGSSW